MTVGRIMKMYGDKPPLYMFSVCVLCLGCGWLVAQHTRFGLEGILIRGFWLLIAIHFADAIIKAIVFTKKNFSIHFN